MANMNTFEGFQSLPVVSVTSTAEFGYKVPASGSYPSLPNPTQVAANILTISALPGDVSSGVLDQGRGFVVRVNGDFTSAQSENITVSLYQCTSAQALAGFTSAATGTKIATTGVQATGAALKGTFNLETALRWDSVSKRLVGEQWGQFDANAVLARATNTAAVTSVNYADLNFYVTFTASVGTSDTIGPFDFTIERY